MSSKYLPVVAAAALLATSAQASVQISAKPTQNMNCAGGVCSPTAPDAMLNADDLAGMLAIGDLTITSGSIAQEIEINAQFSWASTSRLTLDSYHSIAIQSPILVTGTGSLTITTNDGGEGGDYSFSANGHIKFSDTNSDLIINKTNYVLVSSATKIAHIFGRHHPPTHIALAKSSDAAKYGTFIRPLVPMFVGIFEGLGNTIANLTIEDSSDHDVGFFGATDDLDATIRDFGLLNANIIGAGTGQNVGVLAGRFDASRFSDGSNINNCFATGQLTAGTNSAAGGLVGAVSVGVIVQSHANVSILAGDNAIAGGLLGYSNDGFEMSSYATGSVFGGDGAILGGLVGESDSSEYLTGVIDTYSTGAVNGSSNAIVGGLVGLNTSGWGSYIDTSYSIGTVSAGANASIGGFVGQDFSDHEIQYGYWDMDTSDVDNPAQGAGNILNDPGITGLTDARLKSRLPSGLNPTIWTHKTKRNNGYPYLINNPPPQ